MHLWSSKSWVNSSKEFPGCIMCMSFVSLLGKLDRRTCFPCKQRFMCADGFWKLPHYSRSYIYIYILTNFTISSKYSSSLFRRRPRSSRLLARTTPWIIASLPAMYLDLDSWRRRAWIVPSTMIVCLVFFSWMFVRIVNYIYKVQENLIPENPR